MLNRQQRDLRSLTKYKQWMKIGAMNVIPYVMAGVVRCVVFSQDLISCESTAGVIKTISI